MSGASPRRLLLLAAALAPRAARACYLQGVDTGECVAGNAFAAAAPFCADTVGGGADYRVCVPRQYDFFPNLTTTHKDAWVASTVAYVMARRAAIEQTGQPPSGDTAPLRGWEGGMLPQSQWHYVGNGDCARAYKNFICYMNFPRCDATGESLVLCRSVCENFFASCRIADFLNRCYNPQYYGAKDKEADTNVDSNGLPIYSRYFLPGMPFRDIEYASAIPLLGGNKDTSTPPKPLFWQELTPLVTVCTPSLPGAAGAARAPAAAALLLALAAVVATAAAAAAAAAGWA